MKFPDERCQAMAQSRTRGELIVARLYTVPTSVADTNYLSMKRSTNARLILQAFHDPEYRVSTGFVTCPHSSQSVDPRSVESRIESY